MIVFPQKGFSENNSIADHTNYLDPVIVELQKQWPDNRTINLVFHGHSVPSGYFNTPFVNTFDAYPHLVFHGVKEKYPYAVINVITTSIGSEKSYQGAARFKNEVLNHKPDVLFIDYALTDLGTTLERANVAWSSMIEMALKENIKVILLTPTPYNHKRSYLGNPDDPLSKHADQIKNLAEKYNVGLVDSYTLFIDYQKKGGNIDDVMAQVNHPNRKGHEMVAKEIIKWFVREYEAPLKQQ